MLALGAGLAVAALWIGLRVLGGYPEPPEGIRMLRPGEHALLAAAAEATFARGGSTPHPDAAAGVPAYVDRYLAALPPRPRRQVRLLLLLLEHATLLFPPGVPRGLRRFSSLRPEARIAYLEGWQRSRLFARRLVFVSLRSILGLAYLSDARVQRALGLAPKRIPRPVHEADLLWPRIGGRPGEIRFTGADLTPPSDGTPLDPEGPLDPAWEEPPP